MDKLKMKTKSKVDVNIEAIGKLFPDTITEVIKGYDEKGNPIYEKAIDFDVLKQELSKVVVEGREERYQMNWPGKRKSILEANTPINKTLRPCKKGSVDFDTTKNLYIEGDNLDVLKLIRETYLNKVKVIYIDPPYNTGNDSFVYDDNFAVDGDEFNQKSGLYDEDGNINYDIRKNNESNGRFHSDWLNMMYPRLKLARDLLSDDGVIFISIDENERDTLKLLCDHIFNEHNFAGEIIWKNSSKNDQAYISMQHEYILFYVRNKEVNKGEWKEKKEGLDEIFKAFEGFRKECGTNWEAIHKKALDWYKQFPESNPISNSKHYTWYDDINGVYFPDNISGPNDGQYVYDIPHPVTGKAVKLPSRGWFCPYDSMKTKIQEGKIHFGKDETTIPCLKTYLKDTQYQSLTSIKFKDGRVASKNLKRLMGDKYFNNPKDPDLLASILESIGLYNDDIILDFFSGSATTAQSIMEMNAKDNGTREYILVQLQEKTEETSKAYKAGYKNICEIGKERIRRAGKKIKKEHPDIADKLDIGFRVLKVDSSNMKDVFYNPAEYRQDLLDNVKDNVKGDRSGEDLLFQVMLDLGELLSSDIEKIEIEGKSIFNVGQGDIIACFDENITDRVVMKIAKMKPFYAVFRDSSLGSDAVAANFEQIFETYSPDTIRKVL